MEKRSKYLHMRLSAEEDERLNALAHAVGWSRSAVVRHALALAERDLPAMRSGEPPGNRRDKALTAG